MISGYLKAERYLDALEVFDEMRVCGMERNGFVMASVMVA
jgi:pentatricopeptide repeat protein